MRTLSTRIALLLATASAAALVLGVLAVGPATGDDEAAPETVAGIKNVMNAVNHETDGFYGMIRAFCTANPDKDDEGWKLAQHRAIMMAEAGNLLMAMTPPKGADNDAGMKNWRTECAAFRDACKELRKALAFKNAEKVQAALAGVQARCDACHTAHRSQ